jgi:phosphohistidine phosphatase
MLALRATLADTVRWMTPIDMRVILFRHGPAGDRDPARWPDDAARPLTSRGERRTRLAALGLGRIAKKIERVMTSPFERADRTAKILGRELGFEPVETLEALVPGGSSRKVIEALNQKPGASTVVVVGHEPDLGALAGLLVFNNGATIPLKKAGACSITFESAVRPGAGTLEWVAPPRMLCRVTRKRSAV